MKIINREIPVKTRGNTDVIDITDDVINVLEKSGLADGSILLFVRGSTGSLTTVEYEPNLVKDLKDAFERLMPSDIEYAHTRTWGDHNGAGHLRSFLLKTSMTFPFQNERLILGTWQQIIFIECDEKPRNREIFCMIIGE